ncbi:MAG: hypothetical protein EP311_00060 [Cytophagales bacterium]|nr:MAG: hypothetical protein EP311_00060 [Cytophagales bacterium]
MKKSYFIFILLFFLSLGSFAQSRSYAEKASRQKTTGFILLAGGVTAITVALASDLSSDSPSWLVAGSLTTLASIPFFVSAAKNKRRAGLISGNFEMQKFSPSLGNSPNEMVPSFKLKISL